MGNLVASGRINRRDVLLAGAALSVGLLRAPSAVWAEVRAACGLPAHRALLDEFCDAVIPDTDTPGARAAGVSGFVAKAIEHGLRAAPPDLLESFAASLDTAAGGDFLAQSAEQRFALLADVDARSFARPADENLPAPLRQWPTLKALIVVGYYTSEFGGSQELRYRLTPGRFDPDVELEPEDRAWSSDWVAVRFG